MGEQDFTSFTSDHPVQHHGTAGYIEVKEEGRKQLSNASFSFSSWMLKREAPFIECSMLQDDSAYQLSYLLSFKNITVFAKIRFHRVDQYFQNISNPVSYKLAKTIPRKTS